MVDHPPTEERVDVRRSSAARRLLPARLDGAQLAVARAVWLVSAVALGGLATVGFVRAFRDPQLVAIPALVEVFVALGLDVRVMIALALVSPLIVLFVISGVVFWRRSRDPMALLFTMTLLATFTYSSRSLHTFADVPGLRHAVSAAFAVATIGLALLFALFPSGRFAPRSARWIAPAAALLLIVVPDAGMVLETALVERIVVAPRAAIVILGWLSLILLGLYAQTYRYRHVSGPTERQQIKWVMLPLGALFAIVSLALVFPVVVTGDHDRLVGWAIFAAIPLSILFPVMVANAVLRYRLYEIDRIISRTVSYGLLVLALGAVYTLGVVGLGAAIFGLTDGGGGDVVVAGSVLAAVAVFRPVRRRIQGAVDRRFNRTGYEARVAVETFGQGLRDQVQLPAIGRDLARVAAVAVQPTHVSVWLADATPDEPDHGRRGSTASHTTLWS